MAPAEARRGHCRRHPHLSVLAPSSLTQRIRKSQWTTKAALRSSALAALNGIYGIRDIGFSRLAGAWWDMAQILLAEDDESLRRFLAMALAKAGHEVTDFGDGKEAFECLKGFRFDLLLTDIVMPGMDGIELAKRAAEMDQALKIMFITGFAAVALHPSSNAPKQAKVLSKPFHLREIVHEVERMIAA
jgi:two-component system cell cycle response regulator CpdR